jgi:glycosyltransferase involved in cell wall biosynthesis
VTTTIRYLLLHAFGTGGTIRTVINQANALTAAGHDVELVSVLRRRDEPRFPIDPRIPIRTLVDERDGHGPPHNGRLPDRYRAWRRRALARRRPLRVPSGEFGIEYFNRFVESEIAGYLSGLSGGILITTRPALNILAARHADPKVIRVAQEHMNLATHRRDVRSAIARSYPRFDAVVVLTHRDCEDYRTFLPGTRILRIPNAVHSLDQVPSTHDSKIAVAAGRLFAQKGFDLLIPAFGQVVRTHPDWQLRIYGTGRKKDELRALIEEHHLYNNVFLMGHSDRLDDELAKASFFVLSSRFEGLPMVLIEAMSHALPAVSFDCPTGPADVISDGVDGLLVPPEDVDALARGMLRLVEDPELRADLGTAAVKTATDYAPGRVHPQWETLFAELLAKRAPGS